MRVVLTGCSVREPDRAGLRRRYPGGRPVPAPGRGARARRSARAGVRAGADRVARGGRRHDDGRADRRRRRGPAVGDPCPGGRGGDRRARLGDRRLAADHLRLRQDLHLLHRAVQPRPGAQPAVRRHRRRGAGARGGRLPRGHPARPERQLVRPRPARPSRASRTSTTARWAGRRLDLAGRPDLAELIRAIDGLRTADGRPAIGRLRFVTSHPWDLSDRLIAALGRLRQRLRAPPPAGPVGLRRGAPPDGPPVHDRALPRAADADPRGGPGHRDLDRRHRRVLRRDRGAVRGDAARCSRRSATTRSSRRPTRRARGRRRRTSPTTSRPTSSGAGSTSCSRSRRRSASSATRRGSGARSRSWSTRSPRRAATTTRTPAATPGEGSRLSGRTRGNKLVHLAGDEALVGREVVVRIDHAGPYALRGALVGA